MSAHGTKWWLRRRSPEATHQRVLLITKHVLSARRFEHLREIVAAKLPALEEMIEKLRTKSSSWCAHERTKKGKDAPLRWGSAATTVCLDCGAFRMHSHTNPSETVGHVEWRPMGEYEEATTRSEDY